MADVKLPPVLASHMVMQQGMAFPVWGQADAGERVSVSLDDKKMKATVADGKGDWRMNLEPLRADGKPHTLTFTGKNSITLDDLLIGEVWVGSGQSNMAKGVSKLGDVANLPEIRLYSDPQWKICSAETSEGFSAVLFYFGQRLNKELKVPIGLINESRGSKPIEAFMPGKRPGIVYKELVQPLQPVAIKGVIWYQGEANRNDGLAYADKQKAMIEAWRAAWGEDFSFYITQIAPFKGYGDTIDIPSLWEAQLTGLKIAHAGVAVINDTADKMATIHPGNKDKVGQRLANWALARDYGRTDIEYCSPMYKSMKVEGNKIRITFAHAKGLKTSDGNPPGEFEVAGSDGKYVPAKATIDGETVVVEADEVAAPAMARYAWRNTPTVTLVNGAGLPSSAFHTDHWQGGTGD